MRSFNPGLIPHTGTAQLQYELTNFDNEEHVLDAIANELDARYQEAHERNGGMGAY